jgi:hypothetical protein
MAVAGTMTVVNTAHAAARVAISAGGMPKSCLSTSVDRQHDADRDY